MILLEVNKDTLKLLFPEINSAINTNDKPGKPSRLSMTIINNESNNI